MDSCQACGRFGVYSIEVILSIHKKDSTERCCRIFFVYGSVFSVQKHKTRADFHLCAGLSLILISVFSSKEKVVRQLHVLFFPSELLDVDSFLNLLSSLYRKLGERLPLTKLPYDTSLLELPLEFLEGSLDVFAFLYGNYDHN